MQYLIILTLLLFSCKEQKPLTYTDEMGILLLLKTSTYSSYGLIEFKGKMKECDFNNSKYVVGDTLLIRAYSNNTFYIMGLWRDYERQ